MKTVEEILTKIESLDNLEKYQEIIDMIEELPVEQLNSQIISEQGRAYNNIGEYNKAIEILTRNGNASLQEFAIASVASTFLKSQEVKI